ncbi:DUF5994 family protein [Nocardioides panacisoli]|uniref:DUF5994 family protein n=1 Tax=Nocardioides panacisoli TaxID=627624 RepID=A0ABP7J748_9ACTN
MSTLRLRMGGHPGRDRIDGGWWPHSRDFATEFAQLVDHFPSDLGRVVRAVYSPPDWDDAPRRVAVERGNGYVKVGKFPRDDTHLLYVTTADRVVYCLLVVPPSFDASQGEEALLASSTAGNRHTAGQLLEVVHNEPTVDRADLWTSEGGR